MPSYSTLLNNSGSNEKPSNLYMNSPSPYVGSNVEKNDFSRSSTAPPTNGNENAKFYHNNENFYTNQREEKFEPKYGYDEKNFYSNVQQQQQQQSGSIPAPQTSHEDRSSRATRNAVYSNVEPPVPIPVPATVTKGKELIYSNIQWNPKPENTYSNIPAAHSNGEFTIIWKPWSRRSDLEFTCT